MPPRLRQQTLACIDQDHGQVGAGRTGGHVARVLLVPRAVGHDELAPRSTEITIGHVDGDALLALGFEAIDQQRVLERSEERRVGKAWGSTCRSRWSPYH